MAIANRYRVTVLALAALLAAGLLAAVLAKPAWADDTLCVGTLTGPHDNVVVPPGATCTLLNAQVQGSVKALEDSELRGGVNTVQGNVIGDKAEVVIFNASTVRGNIEIKEGEDDNPGRDVDIFNTTVQEGNIKVEKMTGDITVEESHVLKGNIQIFENLISGTIFGLDIIRSDTAQDLQVFKNKGPEPKTVTGNTVGQNLQCFENDPPFEGGPNTAQKAEGQCF
jgi:hypothetical protein